MRRPAVLIPATIALLLTPARAQDHGPEFHALFDGETLEGWAGAEGFWRVEDGAIVGQTTAELPAEQNTFLIWQLGEVDDFELRVKFKMDGGNSGIQYRSWHLGDWRVAGHQADVEVGDVSSLHYHEAGRGPLADYGQKTVVRDEGLPEVVGSLGDKKELLSHIRRGEWNDYRIIARGRRYIHEINGHVMSDVTDERTADYRPSGILALQLHTGPPMEIRFRNIFLKRLPLEDRTKIVFVAGKPSHGFGTHEYRAGCKLLARRLDQHAPRVVTAIYRGGWPSDPSAFDNANAIALFASGGRGHPVNDHLDQLAALVDRGVGLACLHWAVEVPPGEPGDAFLRALGGYFETHWSVNPHWKATFERLPTHPITRGVRPFAIDDEWYYHMRFAPGMQGVTPLLTATPPEETRTQAEGPHSGNEHVRARSGQQEHVAWAFERPQTGRGFGFTGGHFHWAWAHDDYRKFVLNGLLWVAGAEIPAGGLATPRPTLEELRADLDYEAPANFDLDTVQARIAEWNEK